MLPGKKQSCARPVLTVHSIALVFMDSRLVFIRRVVNGEIYGTAKYYIIILRGIHSINEFLQKKL